MKFIYTTALPFIILSCSVSKPVEQVSEDLQTSSISARVQPSTKNPQILPMKVKPYPLNTCLVTDEPLDEWGSMQTVIHKGQEMKFCCKMCLKKFKADPQKYIERLPAT